jgi:hypothetical protein
VSDLTLGSQLQFIDHLTGIEADTATIQGVIGTGTMSTVMNTMTSCSPDISNCETLSTSYVTVTALPSTTECPLEMSSPSGGSSTLVGGAFTSPPASPVKSAQTVPYGVSVAGTSSGASYVAPISSTDSQVLTLVPQTTPASSVGSTVNGVAISSFVPIESSSTSSYAVSPASSSLVSQYCFEECTSLLILSQASLTTNVLSTSTYAASITTSAIVSPVSGESTSLTASSAPPAYSSPETAPTSSSSQDSTSYETATITNTLTHTLTASTSGTGNTVNAIPTSLSSSSSFIYNSTATLGFNGTASPSPTYTIQPFEGNASPMGMISTLTVLIAFLMAILL